MFIILYSRKGKRIIGGQLFLNIDRIFPNIFSALQNIEDFYLRCDICFVVIKTFYISCKF